MCIRLKSGVYFDQPNSEGYGKLGKSNPDKENVNKTDSWKDKARIAVNPRKGSRRFRRVRS